MQRRVCEELSVWDLFALIDSGTSWPAAVDERVLPLGRVVSPVFGGR